MMLESQVPIRRSSPTLNGYVDTNALIYYLGQHAPWAAVLNPLFEALPNIGAIASIIALVELLVPPLRDDQIELANQYDSFLRSSAGFTLVPVDHEIARLAAELRAKATNGGKIRTPDAIHLATALSRRCTAFVTNDHDLVDLPGLRILQLSSYTR